MDPQTLAKQIFEMLGRKVSVFEVEIVQTTRRCAARAEIGFDPHHTIEVGGVGKTLDIALEGLMSAVGSLSESQRIGKFGHSSN